MNKKLLMSLGAAALVATTGVAMASGKYCDEDRGSMHKGAPYAEHYGDKGDRGNYMLDRMSQKLNLTDEQKSKIGSIMDQQRQQFQQRRDAMYSFRTEMQKLDPTSADYVAQVQKLAEKQSASMTERMVDRAKVKAEIYAVLTPEQQSTFKDLMQHRMERKGDHREGDGPHRWN